MPVAAAGLHVTWSACCPGILLDHGYTWVVFTATSVVRDILTSVGANLVELAPADGAGWPAAPTPGAATTRTTRG